MCIWLWAAKFPMVIARLVGQVRPHWRGAAWNGRGARH